MQALTVFVDVVKAQNFENILVYGLILSLKEKITVRNCKEHQSCRSYTLLAFCLLNIAFFIFTFVIGLNLELNIEQDEYIGAFTEEAGVRIDISNQGEMAFPREKGLSAAPGFSTSIGMRKVSVIKIFATRSRWRDQANLMCCRNIAERFLNLIVPYQALASDLIAQDIHVSEH